MNAASSIEVFPDGILEVEPNRLTRIDAFTHALWLIHFCEVISFVSVSDVRICRLEMALLLKTLR